MKLLLQIAAEPDPANRPAIALGSEAGLAADPEVGNRPAISPGSEAGLAADPEVGNRLALDQPAPPGFEPVAGAVNHPVLAPPTVLAFGA